MEIDEFDRKVRAWVEANGGYWTPHENLARLIEEVGEIARHLNAASGRKRIAVDAEPLAGEIGDALFVLALLAAQGGTSLGKASEYVLGKQASRGAGEDADKVK